MAAGLMGSLVNTKGWALFIVEQTFFLFLQEDGTVSASGGDSLVTCRSWLAKSLLHCNWSGGTWFSIEERTKKGVHWYSLFCVVLIV